MMHWDYYTYESQPPFFLEEIIIFLQQENEKQADEARKLSKPKTPGGGMKR